MDKIFGIVYKSTNMVNGKCYIGQTTQTLNRRISGHIHNSIKKMYKGIFSQAIRKYGIENFKWEVLQECYTREELDNTEKIFIEKNKEICYNISIGGLGSSGFKQSPISIEKRRIKLLGKKRTDEQKRLQSERMKGRKQTEEQRQKNIKCHMGLKHSEETRKKMSESHKGKTFTDEHKRNISNSQQHPKKYMVDDVLQAYSLYDEGYSQYEISKIFGVPRTTIQYWLKRKEIYERK
jgi:group I intron endonuclease